MSTAEVEANKATFKRFHEAANADDVEVISKTIDELVSPEPTDYVALASTRLNGDAVGTTRVI